MKAEITIKSKDASITITIHDDGDVQILPAILHTEEKQKKEETVRRCNWCGITYMSIDGEIFCSEECEKQKQQQTQLLTEAYNQTIDEINKVESEVSQRNGWPKCDWCGIGFAPKGKEKFCSDECRKEKKRQLDREYKSKKSQAPKGKRTYDGKNCPRCGRFFIPTGGNQSFCKPDCKPLSASEQIELESTLQQIKTNQNKPVL